jgi:hypothetical protein
MNRIRALRVPVRAAYGPALPTPGPAGWRVADLGMPGTRRLAVNRIERRATARETSFGLSRPGMGPVPDDFRERGRFPTLPTDGRGHV